MTGIIVQGKKREIRKERKGVTHGLKSWPQSLFIIIKIYQNNKHVILRKRNKKEKLDKKESKIKQTQSTYLKQ